MKKYLEIAKIVATQGIKGEVRCQYYCDAPEVLCDFDELYFDRGKSMVKIERAYPHKNLVVLKIEGVNSIEDAQKFIGKMLYLDREDAILPEDTFFIQDMIGLEVKDAETGEVYGKVCEIYQNGAADVYSIKRGDGKELMFPYIDEVVKKIDIEGGEILIKPLDGLFEVE